MRIRLLPAMMVLVRAASFAEDSCSTWMWQKAGLYWRQCVRHNGPRYCQETDDDKCKNVRYVSCTP